ncbi:phosphopantetheine-binding protein [Actimicrobium sp. CCI2.3]|uniref:phosphopantetheine-binding protein n=1 Tax=Actimicrobium sp. CCI2.3 TaxID=3048616 RepID=UPI002AB41691|nr:phosphopantetheine-binding protein [Actimicrobium sp. CCI2.3]MDY7576621.1 phosphopantetheine-binding protein [Actimicrobium sp. CCI2.3]MEB0021222.1 phosphopantetheine-binding protein [Actimicrobium sp. CCI2.3]
MSTPDSSHPASSFSTVVAMLAAQLEVDAATILPETELATLGVDSLTVAELIFDLEDKFDITLGDERPSLVVVQDIVDNIDRYIHLKSTS